MNKNLKFYIPGFIVVFLLLLKTFHTEILSVGLVIFCVNMVLLAVSGYQLSRVGPKYRKVWGVTLVALNFVSVILTIMQDDIPTQVLIAYPILATAIIYQVVPLLKNS